MPEDWLSAPYNHTIEMIKHIKTVETNRARLMAIAFHSPSSLVEQEITTEPTDINVENDTDRARLELLRLFTGG